MRSSRFLGSPWFIVLLLILSAVVFLPGISGPYLFDDQGNIIENSYLRITSLDPRSLYDAAYSVSAGPLQRPVAMLTFALNHYLAGGFADIASWKLTSIAVHAVNGLLLFWLVSLVLRSVSVRAAGPGAHDRQGVGWSAQKATLVAAAVALLWIVHPITLTSVLYIVQRANALSALFVFLALIAYLYGRLCALQGRRSGYWIIGAGVPVFWVLGMLSKENAILLPVFLVILEVTLFPNEMPWKAWRRWSPRARAAVKFALGAAALGFLWFVIDYAAPGYERRDFSMLERVLTQTRVVLFYLSLILVPRINAFGLHHDDIPLSTSLFTPPTTLLAIVALGVLILVAWLVRRRYPLVSLGIAWFFAGHLLESTVFSLEMAHEHRSYLPSAGILLAVVAGIEFAARRAGRRAWALYPLLAAIFAATTLLRASQWSEYGTLVQYEAIHHPNSARTQVGLSVWLDARGRHEESLELMRRVIELEPNEPAWLIDLHIIANNLGEKPTREEQARTVELLAKAPGSPPTLLALGRVAGCLDGGCAGLREPMITWLRTIIEKSHATDLSYYYYLLGRTYAAGGDVLDALNAFQRASELDRSYLHPLFAMGSLFVQLKQVENAELVLGWLREANQSSSFRRDSDVEAFAREIAALKQMHVRAASSAP